MKPSSWWVKQERH